MCKMGKYIFGEELIFINLRLFSGWLYCCGQMLVSYVVFYFFKFLFKCFVDFVLFILLEELEKVCDFFVEDWVKVKVYVEKFVMVQYVIGVVVWMLGLFYES